MRILSGIQPTGHIHLGNYLGALKHWIKLQNEGHECFYPIVDLHALTTVHDAGILRPNIQEAQVAMLALGFDPEKSVLFLQSQVSAHTELAWILTCLTPVGDLERMTQYKEKSQQVSKKTAHSESGRASPSKAGREAVNAGLLTYPTLMAADILLYQADYVPVGEDQKQHLELARNIAEKFNKTYGEIFKLPRAMIQKETARVMSLQDPSKKMSKSLGPQHYIGLFEDENSIRDKIKRAVTDSEKEIKYDPKNKPAISNLLAIYSGITDKPVKEIEKELTGASYAQFKDALADAISKHLRPMQEQYAELKNDPSKINDAFAAGAAKAKAESQKTIEFVREKVGLK